MNIESCDNENEQTKAGIIDDFLSAYDPQSHLEALNIMIAVSDFNGVANETIQSINAIKDLFTRLQFNHFLRQKCALRNSIKALAHDLGLDSNFNEEPIILLKAIKEKLRALDIIHA